MTQYLIRNTKERVWLYEYPPSHPRHNQVSWTLDWEQATRYPTEEAAKAKAKELGITRFRTEKDTRSKPS